MRRKIDYISDLHIFKWVLAKKGPHFFPIAIYTWKKWSLICWLNHYQLADLNGLLFAD